MKVFGPNDKSVRFEIDEWSFENMPPREWRIINFVWWDFESKEWTTWSSKSDGILVPIWWVIQAQIYNDKDWEKHFDLERKK